MNIIIPK